MKFSSANINGRIINKKYDSYSRALFLLISLTPAVFFIQAITVKTDGHKKIKTVSTNKSEDFSKTYIVSGKVTQTFSYCGGAAPPQHLLDKLATPVAYADKKFYIRKGKTNSTKIKVLKSFATNAEGGFSIRLSPGTYAIILEEQLHQIIAGSYKNENLEVDEKCLQKWWGKPYYIVEIKRSDIQNLHFNFHHSCFIIKDLPCITYIGPMPP